MDHFFCCTYGRKQYGNFVGRAATRIGLGILPACFGGSRVYRPNYQERNSSGVPFSPIRPNIDAHRSALRADGFNAFVFIFKHTCRRSSAVKVLKSRSRGPTYTNGWDKGDSICTVTSRFGWFDYLNRRMLTCKRWRLFWFAFRPLPRWGTPWKR